MKIAIVGGLGYIGHALQSLYEIAEEFDVTVIDKDMDLVKITRCPFKVKIADITKEDLNMSEYDIVINLAGITLTYSSDEEEVMKVNYEAAIKLAKTSKRYIFASTNNIFGGYGKQLKDVKENFKPKPKGVYAISKYKVEEWLKENHSNYIICRMGSNFGYSDGMKWSPILNAFMLNSIFNKPITLDNGRDNIRPFVSVFDAANALLFLAHRDDIKNEIFHVVGGNDTLNNLAKKIKKWNKNTKIKKVKKDVWFSGYEINGNKLKKLGFEYINPLPEEFEILRDKIQNV